MKPRSEKQRKLTLISGEEGFEETPNESVARLCSAYAILTLPVLKERRKHRAREIAGLMKGRGFLRRIPGPPKLKET